MQKFIINNKVYLNYINGWETPYIFRNGDIVETPKYEWKRKDA